MKCIFNHIQLRKTKVSQVKGGLAMGIIHLFQLSVFIIIIEMESLANAIRMQNSLAKVLCPLESVWMGTVKGQYLFINYHISLSV